LFAGAQSPPMPTTSRDGVELTYETAGEGPTVAFVGDVGVGAWAWARQVDALAGPARTLVSDHRGTGRSDAPAGPYAMGDLVADHRAVLAAADTEDVHLVGGGLGGLVALEVARESDRVASLVLLGTGADPAAADPLALAADRDDETALRATTERALGPEFPERFPAAVDDVVTWRAEEDADRDGWAAQAAALDEYEPTDLYEVTTEALVVHGTDDEIWPLAGARDLADDLPRGTFEPADGVGHLPAFEASAAVNDRLFDRVAGEADWTED
jgi:3-oxoadipate enol-lactonase